MIVVGQKADLNVCVCVFVRSQTVKGRTQKLQGVWTSPSKHREMCHSCFCCAAKQLKQHILHARANHEHYFVCSECQRQRKKTRLFTAFNKELLSARLCFDVRCYALKYNESIHLQELFALFAKTSIAITIVHM